MLVLTPVLVLRARAEAKTIKLIGERAKRARHYQGCTNSSWCGICICNSTGRSEIRDKFQEC